MLSNMKSRKQILKEFHESISIGEAVDSPSYEDIMKALFDNTMDSQKSYEIIEMIKSALGNSFVQLMFNNKGKPEELTKLVSNAEKALKGSDMEIVDEFDTEDEKEEALDLEPSKDAVAGEPSETSDTSNDVGITVSSSNEA